MNISRTNKNISLTNLSSSDFKFILKFLTLPDRSKGILDNRLDAIIEESNLYALERREKIKKTDFV